MYKIFRGPKIVPEQINFLGTRQKFLDDQKLFPNR